MGKRKICVVNREIGVVKGEIGVIGVVRGEIGVVKGKIGVVIFELVFRTGSMHLLNLGILWILVFHSFLIIIPLFYWYLALNTLHLVMV